MERKVLRVAWLMFCSFFQVETFGMNGEKESNSLYLMRFKSPSRTFLQLTAEQYVVQVSISLLVYCSKHSCRINRIVHEREDFLAF
jgi:hypothetical protein